MSSNQQQEVAIVGTSHSLQIGCASESLAQDLTEFLSGICDRRRVRAIAEEMNGEALAEKCVAASIGMRLAKERALAHCMVDPDSAVRAALGISQENDIRISAWNRSLSRAETEALVQAEYGKRERYWLGQLQDLDTWPVLFICGANHVRSFSTLLTDCSIQNSIEADDWPVEDI